jgi:alpha-ribazole phosphatase
VLILVRHGRTHANAQALLQGHMDPPLDEVGVEQARRTASVLKDLYPTATVVSSPLQRARATAKAISDNIIIDERFIELNYGEYDGVPMTDIPPAVWNEWRTNHHFRPPNGESLAELDARVHVALHEWAERAHDEHIVVVSHVSPIKSAVVWALNGDSSMTWRCMLDRASITRIAVSQRGPSLVGFNDTAHLEIK